MQRRITALSLALTCATLLNAAPVDSTSAPDGKVTIDSARFEALPADQQERVTYIVDRLNTLAATDVRTMERSERKALRSEVKALEREARDLNRGGTVIYLSTGAIILILILLIILL